MASQCRPRRLRTISEFAEDEITIPTGPFEDKPFRMRRQPWIRHLFEAIDEAVRHHTYNEIVTTGPSQSGKSLNCFVLPVLYHLFEVGETVIIGVPEMEMAKDKWEMDFVPVLERTRYKDMLPKSGRGSKGGTVGLVRFRNGASLKFMSGGGSDKTRAYFTSRVVAFTEVNEMASATLTSKEADKIKQIIARTRAFGERRLVYKECTQSVEEGHVQQRWLAGTQTRVFLRCPHCQKFVYPTREHLTGWQDAETEDEAKADSAFYCSSCGEHWSENDRRLANRETLRVDRGQRVEGDSLTGVPANVSTFGFRWSAVHNQFTSTSELGVAEWSAKREIDAANAEKELCQFIWGNTYDDPNVSRETLDYERTRKKRDEWTRGVLPPDTAHLTCGVDCHLRLLYWTAIAWRENGMAHVVDYGTQKVPKPEESDIEGAICEALFELRGKFEHGWSVFGSTDARQPDQTWIDAGYKPDGIYRFIRDPETDIRWYKPILGRGAGQQYLKRYNRPTKTGAMCHQIGDNWHVMWDQARGLHRIELNSDNWKSRLHAMLMLEDQTRGSMTLFDSKRDVEHDTYVRHLMAEEETRIWDEKKGWLTVWEHLSGSNHYLDCTTYATAAASFVGFEFLKEPDPPQEPERAVPQAVETPDGRPFVAVRE